MFHFTINSRSTYRWQYRFLSFAESLFMRCFLQHIKAREVINLIILTNGKRQARPTYVLQRCRKLRERQLLSDDGSWWNTRWVPLSRGNVMSHKRWVTKLIVTVTRCRSSSKLMCCGLIVTGSSSKLMSCCGLIVKYSDVPHADWQRQWRQTLRHNSR